MKKKLVSLLFTLLLPLSMLGQTVGVKTNLLHWASVTPNMAVEVGLAKHVTAELYGAYNSFRIIKKGHTKWKHWFVQPEVRYWTCEKFNGFFVGVHAMGGQFNMVGFKVPPIAYSFNDSYLDKLHNYRYEGDFVGGATYRELLETIYPELRRNTLRVSYVVKGFNLEEALQAYRTNPYQLSLEEMFRISQTFTKGSQDFIDVFKTAVKYFPESEIARINVAAAYLEAGKYSEAKDLLLKAGNSSETLNNLAIVSFYEGNYKQARSYFEQAMAKGSKAAPQNLQELAKFEESL